MRKRCEALDFLAACREWGEWAIFDERYMRPTGVLGIELPAYEWASVEEPWWYPLATAIRFCNCTLQGIYRCLSRRDGWCQWEQNYSFGRWKYAAYLWFTLKAVFCLCLLQWRRSPDKFWDWVDVGAWNLGADYWGEAQGDLLQVGYGVFANWYVRRSMV